MKIKFSFKKKNIIVFLQMHMLYVKTKQRRPEDR